MKRLFLIVLDSVGIGELPDAANYGDVGSNTLKSASKSSSFNGMPNMRRLGYFNIDGVDAKTYFDEEKQGYCIEFFMPANDVKISCRIFYS